METKQPPSEVSKTPPAYPPALDTWSAANHQLIAIPQGYLTVPTKTSAPLHLEAPGGLECGLRPHSSENLAATFFRIRSDIKPKKAPGCPKSTAGGQRAWPQLPGVSGCKPTPRLSQIIIKPKKAPGCPKLTAGGQSAPPQLPGVSLYILRLRSIVFQ